MIKGKSKSLVYLLACLNLVSLIFVGCTSSNNSATMQQQEMGMTNNSQQQAEMTNNPSEKEGMFTQQDQEFAADYPKTMEQCMFIDEASVQLGEDGQVAAKITVKEDITEEFLSFRMNQHMEALIEQYGNHKIELVATYHNGAEAARAEGINGEVKSMEINAK